MKDIQVCLWFDGQAEEAARFYGSTFNDSRIGNVASYGEAASKSSGQPEGSVMTVEFTLSNFSFLALNGGPHFHIDPSLSFVVGCDSEAEMDRLWERLNHRVRMELKHYPFTEKYGWCEDRFGVNWQLILGSSRPKISPALLFANKKFGKAEEAIQFYLSIFPNSRVETIARDDRTKAVLHARVILAGQEFVFLEGPLDPAYDFSPAVSFILGCDSQEEIDALWSRLSAVSEAEACGWLKDRYGVSWQVIPKNLGKMIHDADPEERERLMAGLMEMKKPDILGLNRALANRP